MRYGQDRGKTPPRTSSKRHTFKASHSCGFTNVYALPILPAWQFYTSGTDTIPGAPLAWSNPLPPPAIGTTINARINGIGPAVVVSYFAEHGFLGLEVAPLSPPEWYVEQNGPDCSCCVFGAEIDPREKPKAPPALDDVL